MFINRKRLPVEDQSQNQYYFQRGYQDGYNSQMRCGYGSGGTMNIIGSILNIREY